MNNELRWLQATGYRQQADPLPAGEGNAAPHPLRFALLRRGSSCDAQRGADERPLPWGEGNVAERVGEGWTVGEATVDYVWLSGPNKAAAPPDAKDSLRFRSQEIPSPAPPSPRRRGSSTAPEARRA